MIKDKNCPHYRLLHKGYEIFEIIGSGGMSEVFYGRNYYLDKFNNEPLAIKRLRSEFYDTDTALYSFETEFMITKNLIHENVLKIHDFVISKKDIFLVMDLLEGVTSNKIESVTTYQNFNDRIKLVLEILSGMAFIHSNLVIHGDIKPSNIFICSSGGVKIIDFGLSASETRAPSSAAYAVSLKYSSPERLRDGKISYRDDVYALGCIMYELLSDRHPFDNTTSLIARDKNLCPRTIDHLDLNLNKMLSKMLSFDPASRPESAAEVLYELKHIT